MEIFSQKLAEIGESIALSYSATNIDEALEAANKIGYPDQWRDYSAIRIARDDHFGNVARATRAHS